MRFFAQKITKPASTQPKVKAPRRAKSPHVTTAWPRSEGRQRPAQRVAFARFHKKLANGTKKSDFGEVTESLSLTAPIVRDGVATPAPERAALVDAICVLISEKGHTLTSACDMLSLHRHTVERWCSSSAELGCALARARSVWREQLITSARSCKTKWGTMDPQVAMFLLERTQEDYRQSRSSHETQVTVVMDVRSLERLQQLQRRVNAPVLDADIVPQASIEG